MCIERVRDRHIDMHTYVCVYIYIYMYVCVYIYIYIFIQRERESERETDWTNSFESAKSGAGLQLLLLRRMAKARLTVSFHNFKSQNFKLSVSNPKSKYVAYSSVLSQISNCQGLGRKNKHESLKTDRKEVYLFTDTGTYWYLSALLLLMATYDYL